MMLYQNVLTVPSRFDSPVSYWVQDETGYMVPFYLTGRTVMHTEEKITVEKGHGVRLAFSPTKPSARYILWN